MRTQYPTPGINGELSDLASRFCLRRFVSRFRLVSRLVKASPDRSVVAQVKRRFQDDRDFKRSRISARSFSCGVGSGGVAGLSGGSASILFFSVFMPLTTIKMQNATITKSMHTLMNWP